MLAAREVRSGSASVYQRLEEWMTHSGVYERLKSAGGMGALWVKALRLAASPPYAWRSDAVVEASLAVRRCMIPLFVASSAYAIALIGVYGGNILELLGARDRIGGPGYIAAVREPSVWATMMIFAGVAGSAIAADLGARRIRDELDALSVLGVDTVRALVVPRVVALALIAPILGVISLAVSVIELYIVAPPLLGVSHASFMSSLTLAVFSVDLLAFLVKFFIIGMLVAVVACYKGLTAGGGAEGVGRAVNATMVITFFALWALTVAFNSGYLSLFPEVTVQRG